ncbi:MAG TPA: thioredoxin domain-containing protein [Gemmatimonadaceae bacterium]
MANRLADSTSPYLRQHAANPVDWYPWGDEALHRARSERMPILLSIGYAACHWCHVMAHESFEDPSTAALMNELFVNIKVDREERPDLDGIYMQAVQALAGQGGWPMTVFLTPEGVPFHGGTYFPPQDRHGIPSFQRVLRAVSNAWREKPDDVAAAARALEVHLQRASMPADGPHDVDRRTLDLAFRALARAFDPHHAGFGGAPRFPPTMALDFLLRHWARTGEALALDIVQRTHAAMRHGGIYDQVGGGLHRYSVDDEWLVPHFEKMLYDNALFARLGVHLWQATQDLEVRATTEQTLDWAAREMRDSDGGFHSSLDADSDGHEGLFYVWGRDEFMRVAGEDAAVAEAHWGVSASGNFEGRSILFVPHGMGATAARTGLDTADAAAGVERARARLLEARAPRVSPARDEKVIASWNGLMVRAFAEAARVFGRPRDRDIAVEAGRYLAERMVTDGRVTRSLLGAHASGPGFLEDHAAVALAFLDLHALTFATEWLDRSRVVVERTIDLFLDVASGTWYDTPRDGEPLLIRPREVTDNATPAGTSLVAELLLRWADLDDRSEYRELSRKAVSQVGAAIAQYPLAFGHVTGVADSLVNGSIQIAIVGDPDSSGTRSLADRVAGHYVPGLVLAGGPSEAPAVTLLRDRLPVAGAATAFVCRGFACDLPTNDPDVLDSQVSGLLSDISRAQV